MDSGAARADAPKPYEVVALRSVAYYDEKGADAIRHKLDLFLPKGKKDYPVIVFVHGGAERRSLSEGGRVTRRVVSRAMAAHAKNPSQPLRWTRIENSATPCTDRSMRRCPKLIRDP